MSVESVSGGSTDKIQAIIDAGVAPRLVELWGHSLPTVQTPALRTIANIVTSGTVDHIETVIAAGDLVCVCSF